MSYKFVCGALPTMNGHTLKAVEPDANGFYPCVLGAIGIPTRANVWYDEKSMIEAMSDPTSRFNICLKDGNLCGCWGHPVVATKDDIPKLLAIDEAKISHMFGKIWIDDTPTPLNGMNAHLIRGLVKPFGPYGDVLERSLKDPCINTAFSIRSLCLPMSGPNPAYEYRKVQIVVTFDAVHAPGVEVATKRYVTGTENFETDISREDLEKVVASNTGLEGSLMITDQDILKLYKNESYTMNGRLVSKGLVGNNSILGKDGSLQNAASLRYGRR